MAVMFLVDLVDTLHKEVWGQGFAPPTFSEEVEVLTPPAILAVLARGYVPLWHPSAA